MDPSAVPVFLAGPFPVIHSAHVLEFEQEVELDIGLIYGLPRSCDGVPARRNVERVEVALNSGDAWLGVAGVAREGVVTDDRGRAVRVSVSSARTASACRRSHPWPDPIRVGGLRAEVMSALLNGQSPAELGELIDD